MTDTANRVLELFEQLIPKLSEIDRERLLGFGEGLIFKTKPDTDTHDPEK